MPSVAYGRDHSAYAWESLITTLTKIVLDLIIKYTAERVENLQSELS